MPLTLERSKEFAARFLDWVRGKGKVLVVAHDNPDPDCLASAMALQHLLLSVTGQEVTIAFSGVIGRGENRAMVELLEVPIVPLQALELESYQVVCMVDTQPGTGNNSYPEDRPVHLVIDHHPLRSSSEVCRFHDIREDYGASATILLEYLLANEVTFGTKLATALLYAIKSETQDLGRDWCRADRAAYLELLPLVNNRMLYKIAHPKVPRSYFASFKRAIDNAVIYDDLLVFNLFEIDNPDLVAEMADLFLRTEDASVVFGMGNVFGEEILSMRTSRPDIMAGQLIFETLKGIGTAGGHGTSAGGQIREFPSDRPSQLDLQGRLTERLLQRLDLGQPAAEPLVPAET